MSMGALDKKLLRDFRRLWVQALAIALVLACGVMILLTAFGMYGALNDSRQAYYERNRFADIFVQTRRAPASLLPEILAIDGVAAAEARVVGDAILDLPGRSELAVGRILSLPEGRDPALNVPLLRSGRLPDPARTDEVAVNEPFAEANGFAAGDVFLANLNGQQRQLTITGTVLSPEFIYTIGPGAMMPDSETFGILFMPERAAAAAFDMTGAFNDLSLLLSGGARDAEVIDAVDALLEPYGGLGAVNRTGQVSDSFVSAELAQLRGTALILPPVFFAISAFLVGMVLGRIVALERSEIGLLKAVGYSDLEVCVHYLLLAALIALVGIAVGWATGSWLARLLALQYARWFDFPYVIFRVSYGTYAISALLALLTTTLGAARAALAAARLAPAVAMQPPAPPRFRRSFLDRLLVILRISQPTMMVLRSFIRWPVRSALTVLGLSMAVAAVIAAFYMNDALDEIIDTAFTQSNRQDAIFLFAQDADMAALEEARDLPGVLLAEPQQFHAAVLRHGPRSKRVAVEARPPGMDLSRVVDADGARIDVPPGGIVLSERLAGQLDARVGDVIEAEFLSGARGTYEMSVVALIDQYFGLGAYVDMDYLNRLFRQEAQVSTINITVDSARIGDLHEAIKDIPGITSMILMSDNVRAFQDTIEQNVVVMNGIYITISLLITIGVAYNGARIQLSERARELASLRILGFTRREVSSILIGETMILSLLAQPVGWLVGTGLAVAMTNSFTSDLYGIPLVLKPHSFATASLIVLSASLLSVLVVRRRLDNLDLVSVMKTRE